MEDNNKVTGLTNAVVSVIRNQIRWVFCLAMLISTVPAMGDQIVVSGGRNYEGVTITSATWEQVQYRLPGVSTAQKIDADRVLALIFDQEPSSLSRGRGALEQGDWDGAVSSLRSATSLSNPRQKADAMYLYGVALAQLANQDPAQRGAAIEALEAYLTEFESKKDFYVPHARMALSGVHRRAESWSDAGKTLASLAGGDLGKRWVLGARLGNSEILLAQDKFVEAREVFSAVANDSEADSGMVSSAWLGYAICQLGQRQWSAAIDTVRQKVLESRNAEISGLSGAKARAWLIWGRATQEQASGDKTKLQWAMIRYLRAAVIATTGDSETLAEAIYRAKSAATDLGETERAAELAQRLQKLVPNSAWNK
jgi:tetratricopeptide (TPR) repeat protein